MKKLKLLTLVLFSALVASCSNDKADEENDPQNTARAGLVKKIIFTYDSPNYIRTFTYNLAYDGNKLISVQQEAQQPDSFDESTVDFHYTGDLITSIDNILGEGVSGNYTYSGGRLASINYSNMATAQYTYQTVNNQTIVAMTATSGAEWYFYYEGETVVKEGISSVTTPEYIYDCSYDNKKNPFNNITGLDKLHYNLFFYSALDYRVLLRTGANNLTALQSSTLNPITISYTYNNEGYPTEAVITSPVDNLIANVEYFY